MKSKKSQGLSINMIIIAVIALIVLVVVIAIFTNTTEKTSTNIDDLGSCDGQGGQCASASGTCPLLKPDRIFVPSGCETRNNQCCVKADN